ncbi:hypothetical protein J5X98_19320 [Leptothermofonsia sichuanensis E412]|jgi:hypothetical protein|uniref:hypothetical protein n=1 Tax=Leptothermofonsia sichuanensis TaxID=2917832 RepID=UPI001CA766A2|nr:hypothetical protein [Leptothermofonsia sichuanensis]QZZ19490.1 hypothetical protein J5X98_19320 [Leptothermofonsia sichuanensis E412]
MIPGLIVFSTLTALLLADFFGPKPSKTPEEKLGEALTDYLKAGIKVRKEDKPEK